MKSNTISIKNSSNESISIIVEYIFFTIDLLPNQVFQIEVIALPDINVCSFFDVDYEVSQITIYLKNELRKSYKLKFFINDECIHEQLL